MTTAALPRPTHASATRAVAVERLGTVPYRQAWRLQRERVGRRAAGAIPDTLLLLSHPPVVTLGKGGSIDHLVGSGADLERRGVALEAGEWKAITTPSATGPVRARVLEALAAVSGVAPGYFLALGDEELREATEAQLDFRSALRETGADSVAARAVGEVSPSALRAIAASLRSAGR